MEPLKDFFMPLTLLTISGLSAWVYDMNDRIYTVQKEYVTQAQMGEAVRALEDSIKTTIRGEEGVRQAQQAMLMQWLDRIETQQQTLSSDVKALLKDNK